MKNQPDSQTEDVTTTERTKETAVHTPFDKFDGKSMRRIMSWQMKAVLSNIKARFLSVMMNTARYVSAI